MTEQQREAFEAWYNEEYVRPIIPADRTEGGYQHPDAQAAWDAWQAALSHAERREFKTEQDLISFLDGLYETAGPDSSALTGQKWAPAQRAIEGIRSHAEGEAFGWFTEDHDTDKSATTYDPVVADRWRKKGWPVWPLYTHPAPHAEGEAVTFMRTWKSEPIYTCNKPGDMGGTYCPAPQVAGLTETAIKSSPAYRALHREKEHLLGLLKDQAPQVAVPEGWKLARSGPVTINGEEFYGVRIVGPDGGDIVWENRNTSIVYGFLSAMLAAAPTAPAGEPEILEQDMPGMWSNSDLSGGETDCQPAQQPVSDPGGLPEILAGPCTHLTWTPDRTPRTDQQDVVVIRYADYLAMSAPAPDEREIAAYREALEKIAPYPKSPEWELDYPTCRRIARAALEQGDRLRAGTDSDPGRTVKPHRSGGGLRPSESDSGHMGIATEPSVADRLRAGKGDES